MKSLKDCIVQSNPDNELEQHFFVEFLTGYSYSFYDGAVLEKYGTYKGQKELVLDLYKEITNSLENKENVTLFTIDKKDLSKYSNIFFNKLIIKISDRTCYENGRSKFQDNMFDEVHIKINPEDIVGGSLMSCLTHELLHAWNDYQLHMKDEKFDLSKLGGKKYAKTLEGDLTKTTPENICKTIVNNLTKMEQNAYLSELSMELCKNNFNISKYQTPREAYKAAYWVFVNSDTLQRYQIERDYVRNLKDKSEEEKDRFVDEYNYLKDKNYNFDTVCKKLEEQFKKVFHKIESIVPKIFYQYYQEESRKLLVGENIIETPRGFIKEVRDREDYQKGKKITDLNINKS